METIKKKRGCNYTSSEKNMLLELVKKHQHIIENKETNSNMILKKRETWTNISQQYNAVAASGCRSWEQLRHLYENLKQRSKKNIANVNQQQFYEKTSLKEVQTKASLDKKEINRTGGGCVDENAKIETKYLINKNKMAINQYKLEMEILKLRLKKMQQSKKN